MTETEWGLGEASAATPLALIAEMSRDFAVSRDPEESLRRALGRISDHVGAEGGSLFLLDEETGRLECRACVGPVDITGLVLRAGQGIVGRSAEEGSPSIVRDVADDPSFHNSVDEQTGFTTRSLVCAPMSVHENRIGAIELVNKRGGDGLFTEADLQVLQVLASSAALAILNARMAAALVEQEKVRHELELAAEIQRSLLPPAGDADYPVHGVNVAARQVSGDFYDFFRLPDGRFCFNLGDVSGKGMNAALLMAKTASIFRCLGKTLPDPGRLMERVNAEICETVTRGMFVTMVAGLFDPRTGVVRLVNAGHEPALIFAGDGTVREVPADAPPLGISPLLTGAHGFPEVEVALDGGVLYAFSDGVTEGRLIDGGALGGDGVRALLNEVAGLPVPERLASVVRRLARPGLALRDDVTILALQDRREWRADPVPSRDEEWLVALELVSSPDRLRLARGVVGEAAQLCGFSAEEAGDLILAVDEACQNIIRHTYGGAADGKISIQIRRCRGGMEVYLRDWGAPVDRARVKPRDLEDLRPGGLGTRFIGEIMDEVDFLPPPGGGGGGNLLRMVKHLKQ